MNRTIKACIVLFFLTTAATAAEGPSIERGKELFNSIQLGTNGRSCADCHSGGKGLENAGTYDVKALAKISNQCIVKALKGKALADASLELSSLVMYLNTFATAKSK